MTSDPHNSGPGVPTLDEELLLWVGDEPLRYGGGGGLMEAANRGESEQDDELLFRENQMALRRLGS